MPIYEYRRPDGTTFDIQQSFSDDPLKVDPETGVPVERVLHPPAVHFKGKGFYNTDYGTRNRQRETAAAAEKTSKSDGAASGGDSASSSGEGKGGKGGKDGSSEGAASTPAAKDAKPVAAKS
jgi:predicted nucleic acid-binding Zn ribbon protein